MGRCSARHLWHQNFESTPRGWGYRKGAVLAQNAKHFGWECSRVHVVPDRGCVFLKEHALFSVVLEAGHAKRCSFEFTRQGRHMSSKTRRPVSPSPPSTLTPTHIPPLTVTQCFLTNPHRIYLHVNPCRSATAFLADEFLHCDRNGDIQKKRVQRS